MSEKEVHTKDSQQEASSAVQEETTQTSPENGTQDVAQTSNDNGAQSASQSDASDAQETSKPEGTEIAEPSEATTEAAAPASDDELSEEELDEVAGGMRLGGYNPAQHMANQFGAQGAGAGAGAGASQAAGGQTSPFDQDISGRFNQMLNFYDQFLQGGAGQGGGQAALPTQGDPSLSNSVQQHLRNAQMGNPAGFQFKPTASAETPLLDDPSSALPKFGITPDSKDYQKNNKTKGNTKTDKGKNAAFGPGTYGVGNTLLGGEAYLAEAGKFDTEAKGDWGRAYAGGTTRFGEARGRIYDKMGFNPSDGTLSAGLGAQAQLNLVRSAYNVGYDTPTVNIGGRDIGLKTNVGVEGFVGAQGDAEASITLGKKPGIKIGAGGFAGASVSATGSAEAGGIGVWGSATGWAGAGAKADFTLGFGDDGKFRIGFDVGAALGIGGQLSWGITIDPKEVFENIKAIGSEIAGGIEKVGTKALNFAKDVGTKIASKAKDVANTIKTGVKKAGSTVKNFVQDVGNKVKDVGKKIGGGIKKIFSGW